MCVMKIDIRNQYVPMSQMNRDLTFRGQFKPALQQCFDLFKKGNQKCTSIPGKYNIKVLLNKVMQILKPSEKELPVVSSAMVLFFMGLQIEDEFKKELMERTLKNEYISPNSSNIAKVLTELENKRIIKPEYPYDAPRFCNGILTQNAYDDIIEKVKGAPSYLLNDMQKRDIINSLAKSNYHSEDIIYSDVSFGGINNDVDVDVDEISGLDDVGADIDDDGGIIDAILDFLDDLF